MFMWLLSQDRLQTRALLMQKNVIDQSTCEVCGQHEETQAHIFCSCGLASQLWNCLGIDAPLQPDNVLSWPRQDMIPSEGFSTFIALCCWQLWKSKNKKVFRNQATGLHQLLQQCSAVSVQWGFRLQPSKRHIVQAWEQAFESARQWEG